MKKCKKIVKIIDTKEKIIAIFFIAFIFITFIFYILKGFENIKKIEDIENIESIDDIILGKEEYINIYGLVQRIIGRRYIEDSNDETRNIVKLNNGMISFIQERRDMKSKAKNIANFNKILKDNKISFMYLQAPFKIRDNKELPTGITDYANSNADELVQELNNNKVKLIDLRKLFSDKKTEEIYLRTDHHWKIKTAFETSNYISRILNDNNNFNIEKELFNKDNYIEIETGGRFLGSIGKRIGKYYVSPDKFTYILPKYETKLTVNNVSKKSVKTGGFEETIISKNCLNIEDITTNQYACYFGADYPEIIIKNGKTKSDKKLLIIQDSYGLPFSAFMSLRVKELRIIDLRHFEKNEIEYIKEYNPDMVLMIYNPSSFGIDKNFDFR